MAPPSEQETDRLCLRALRCPNSRTVRNRLTQTKDQIRHHLVDWVLKSPQYTSWHDGDDICLLWIKGGAGKGKTMMTLSLISRLSRPRGDPPMVIYFFCQNADYELNNIVAIIKGLVLQLIQQNEATKECLRSRWDTAQKRFTEDLNSWQNLWSVLWEMIDRCSNDRVFIIVDALDECVDDDMAEFLRLIVRNGLDHPGRIKWLLTSRPLDAAERELLTGRDQVQVSLELNSANISEAVQKYIIEKAKELDRRAKYGDDLRQRIESELLAKADGGFLWVSLVCKELESVHRDYALKTMTGMPPGLSLLYSRALEQVSIGDDSDVQRCLRLLHVMKLAYRPLRLGEVSAVTAMAFEADAVKRVADRCASFLRVRADRLEFVHQSAREFLRWTLGTYESPALDNPFGHMDIALSCLSYLRRRLKANLLDLSRLDSTREFLATLKCDQRQALLSDVEYGATFWVQHLEDTNKDQRMSVCLTAKSEAESFLNERLLEWLECLSWLGSLSKGIGSLRALGRLAKVDAFDHRGRLITDSPSFALLIEDATRFLLRHYQTLVKWPLQIYSSAVIFSPESSLIRRQNVDKIPTWLMRFPPMENDWSYLIQTLNGHFGDRICSVEFSPNGAHILSRSKNGLLNLWDAVTGELQKAIHPISRSTSLQAVAFSPDSKKIAAGFGDDPSSEDSGYENGQTTPGHVRNFVQILNTSGQLLYTYLGHSGCVCAVVFSPDGKQVASRSTDDVIMLRDAQTGQLRKQMSSGSRTPWHGPGKLAYSADGTRIAADFGTIVRIWDAVTGRLERTLPGQGGPETYRWNITDMSFSRDSRIAILYSSGDVEIWDLAVTCDIDGYLLGDQRPINLVGFFPDGAQIATISIEDAIIDIWDSNTYKRQKSFKLEGHSNYISSIAISPDGKQIASGSWDGMVKLWGTTARDIEQPLKKHEDWVTTVAISPDGKRTASGSMDETIKIWNSETSSLEKTISSHPTRKLSTIWDITFSPNGSLIACDIGDRTIIILDPLTGEFPSMLEAREDLEHLPSDPLQFYKGERGVLYLYRLKGLGAYVGLRSPMVFSPDSKQIVSGGSDGTVRLWNLAKGIVQKKLTGHSKSIMAVSLSSDGTMIASGSSDTTVKLWDAKTGNLLKTLVGHMSPINSLAFSADGTSLASSDDDNLRIWNIPSCLRASGYIGRTLSSRFKFRSSLLDFTTSHTIYSMRFLPGNQSLSTNAGPTVLDETNDENPEDIGLETLQDFWLMGNWICYGVMPCLLLPPDFQPECYDIQGDLIFIGLQNGRVLNFCLDRKALHSLLKRWTSGVLAKSALGIVNPQAIRQA